MSDFRQIRPDNFPPIVKNLIIINVLVYIAQISLTQFEFTERIQMYPVMPEKLLELLSQSNIKFPPLSYYVKGYKFEPYQIATHMFAHSPYSFMHIIFNMFGLWMFGKALENVWGPQRFLLFYFACGVGAAICHLGIHYFQSEQLLEAILAGQPADNRLGAVAPAVGASGAIMGIFAAFAFLFPNTELMFFPIPIPVKAKWAVLGLAAFDLFGGISNMSNIAHFAHLGGALTGFIIVLFWNKNNRKRFY